MGILSSLFGLNSKEEEKTVVVKVPTKSVVEPTIKESLANLAIEVIGASERTALIPLKENNVSTKYSELVKLGLENSANAKILKKQLDNINYYNNTILKAQELLKYLKDVNNCLGNSVIDDFNTGIPGFYNKEDALLVIEHFKEILDKIY